jgi:hypothetical protein
MILRCCGRVPLRASRAQDQAMDRRGPNPVALDWLHVILITAQMFVVLRHSSLR